MFGTKLSYFTCLYRLILACIIKQFLGLLLILFTFVGNKINQVNVVKRSKDEREKHGNLQGKKNDGHRGSVAPTVATTCSKAGSHDGPADGRLPPLPATPPSWPTSIPI